MRPDGGEPDKTDSDARDETASGAGDGTPGDPDGAPSDAAVVETAAAAVDRLVFSRFSQSEVGDVDVRVTFEDGTLDVDVYLHAADDADVSDRELQDVADDAALAARGAVDELFAE